MNEIYWMTVIGNLSTALTVVCGVIAAMASIFIPSTKEMLLIYGVGGTIDYIRKNDTAKQLPDKCIKVLDCFADKYIDEPKKDK